MANNNLQYTVNNLYVFKKGLTSMVINNFRYTNLNNLYKAIAYASQSGSMFMKDYTDIYNETTISFDITLSSYEYTFLKMMATYVSPPTNRRIINEDNDQNYGLNINNNSQYSDFYALLSDILEATKKEYHSYYLPSGLFTCDCTVLFTGKELGKLLTMRPNAFFVKLLKEKVLDKEKSENNQVLKTLEDDELNELFNSDEFEDNFIDNFVNEFYKYIYETATMYDEFHEAISPLYLTSDDDASKTTSGDSKYNLVTIVNPNMMIDLLNDEVEDIGKKLNYYKVFITDDKVHYTIYNTALEFSLNTPYCVFENLFSILPADKFAIKDRLDIYPNISDHSLVPNIDETIQKSGYGIRFTGAYERCIAQISDMIDNNNSGLKKVELTMPYIPYKYNIKITFSDFDKYLLPYVKAESNLTIKTRLGSETSELINGMFKISQTFYKTMMNIGKEK